MSDFRTKLRRPDCTLCDLNQSAMTVCLMGSGPSKARIMIVGEAPGANEDEGGEPFVGPSGKLLNKMLLEIGGIDRSDCYVTNSVKCRPPANRNPRVREVKLCTQEYLHPEIERVRPDYILTLGNFGLKGVTGSTGITRHHGTPRPYKGNVRATVFPTYHPAVVMRNPAYGEAFGMDLLRFGEMVRGTRRTPDTKVHIIDTPKKLKLLKRTLMRADEIAWDIETYTVPSEPPYERTNFQEYWGRDSLIVSVAFSWREGVAAALPLWHSETPWKDPAAVLEMLLPALTRSDCKYIGHNVKFDQRWMRAKGVPIPQSFCTMLAAHIIEENRPKKLKDLSQVILGADAYDVGEELKDAYYMELLKLLTYNAKDSDYTFRLKHVFHRQLKGERDQARIFTRLMMPASRALVRVEQRGVWMDQERWAERYDVAQGNVRKLESYLNRKFVPEERRPLNFRAPRQVGWLLFDYLELPVVRLTASEEASTDASVLKELARDYEVARVLLKHRKWTKRVSTYFIPWRYRHLDRRGRLHSDYKPAGTATGRLAGTGGIQQVPRDPWMRSLLGGEPGWSLLQADYSQIELRIAAMIADEERMLRQYFAGEDLHMIRACKMTGKLPDDVTKEERSRAKPVSFGFIYGMWWLKFIKYAYDEYEIVFTEQEAQDVRNGFFEDYPRLLTWHETMRRLARENRRVRSPLGQWRNLPDMRSAYRDVRERAERQAINAPVQTTASHIMLDSLCELEDTLNVNECRIVASVHDAILFEVREGLERQYAPYIKETMEDMDRIARRYKAEITVPIIVDLECSTHWSDETTKIKL